MAKDEKVLCGTITEMESGEKTAVEFIPFFTDVELMTMVRVEGIEKNDFTFDDEEVSFISVSGKALDSIGLVFDIELEFWIDKEEEENEIVADMKTGAIFLAKGSYRISSKEMLVTLRDPEYLPLPPEFDEQKIREVFRVNERPLKKVQ